MLFNILAPHCLDCGLGSQEKIGIRGQCFHHLQGVDEVS